MILFIGRNKNILEQKKTTEEGKNNERVLYYYFASELLRVALKSQHFS
jgi:hypothetical protein